MSFRFGKWEGIGACFLRPCGVEYDQLLTLSEQLRERCVHMVFGSMDTAMGRMDHGRTQMGGAFFDFGGTIWKHGWQL